MSEQKELVVISGGTKGLGRALSLTFARKGYQVWAIYHADQVAADCLEKIFKSENLDARTLRHDIRLPFPSLPEFECEANWILVHNAATAVEPKPFHLISLDDIRSACEVSVFGGFFLAQFFIRKMVRARRGTVVVILTEMTSTPLPPKGFAAYVTAKCGLRGLFRALEAEYAERGIRFIEFSPGFMKTEMTKNWPEIAHHAASTGKNASSPEAVAYEIFNQVNNK